jgi:plasmid stabilization system protein ParE
MRVRYRRRAQRDIENIHEYIEKRNPQAATDVVARIRYAADRLGTLPYMGHVGRDMGTYEWVVVGSPYVIVYEVMKRWTRSQSWLCSTAHNVDSWRRHDRARAATGLAHPG